MNSDYILLNDFIFDKTTEQNLSFDKSLLNKSYCDMSDDERSIIVEVFPKIFTQLQELQQRYDNLLDNFEELALVQGEKQAIESGSLKLLTLHQSHKLTEKNIADEHHFRLAESQFYRLIYGLDYKISMLSKTVSYKISHVDYVVNPRLLERFTKRKSLLREARGAEYCKTVLGFHGTDDSNIESICERGFLDPTHRDFHETTDSGYYGRGIYFSQYPTYAMQYIRGRKMLLLCQILLGRVFCCDVVNHGQNCEPGYDSHRSPTANELIVFNSDQILPRYVVHFETIMNEVDDIGEVAQLVKYDSKFDLPPRRCQSNDNAARPVGKRKLAETDIMDILDSGKRIKPSRSMEGIRVHAESPSWSNEVVEEIQHILLDHGAILDNENFSIFITDNENFQSMGESFRTASEKNVPCILITSLMKMLNEGQSFKDSVNDYHITIDDI